jgi:hypothetical protein
MALTKGNSAKSVRLKKKGGRPLWANYISDCPKWLCQNPYVPEAFQKRRNIPSFEKGVVMFDATLWHRRLQGGPGRTFVLLLRSVCTNKAELSWNSMWRTGHFQLTCSFIFCFPLEIITTWRSYSSPSQLDLFRHRCNFWTRDATTAFLGWWLFCLQCLPYLLPTALFSRLSLWQAWKVEGWMGAS